MSIDLNTHVHVHHNLGANHDYMDNELDETQHGRAVHAEINDQEQALIDKVSTACNDGTVNSVMVAVASGQPLSDDQINDLMDVANTLSPSELKQLAAAGVITDQDANMLIVAGGIKNSSMWQDNPDATDNARTALTNFMAMSPQDQDVVLDQFSQISVDHKVTVMQGKIGAGNEVQDLTTEVGANNPSQERTALFLAKAGTDNLSDVSKFVNWDFDSSDGALAAALSGITNWDSLTETQQNGLTTLIQSLGSENYDGDVPDPNDVYRQINGEDPENPLPPQGENQTDTDYYNSLPDDWKSVVDLGTLMYQVMADRVQTMDDQVRGYAADVEKKNAELKQLNDAMAQLRAGENTDPTKTTNIAVDIKLSDGTTLADYLDSKGIPRPDSDELKPEQVADLLTSMKNEADTMTSESQLAMTKLQQQMDKYSQAVSTLTNFESKWNTMMGSILGNLR